MGEVLNQVEEIVCNGEEERFFPLSSRCRARLMLARDVFITMVLNTDASWNSIGVKYCYNGQQGFTCTFHKKSKKVLKAKKFNIDKA
ncbi:hypothetical protein MKX03_029973, partial [Papaver bracteatum]